MSNATEILQAVQRGAHPADQLVTQVYGELSKIAACKMAQEPQGHTLDATDLVHEAWLRIVKYGNYQFESRGHFFAVAAEAMRRILIEAARRNRSLKRGGRVPHEKLDESNLAQQPPCSDLLAVNEALDQLSAKDRAAADLVKLRYFHGMSMNEVASTLGLSVRTTERLWTYARTWLGKRMSVERREVISRWGNR